MKAGQCRLDISGDVHHYARYWGPETAKTEQPRGGGAKAKAPAAASYASVVSGIGGAFHHPSGTYVDQVREQVLYPSENDSTTEVARRIFKPWNIWQGGSVWIAGFIIAFVIYFASAVPQSSRQVTNNFSPLRWIHLIPPSNNDASRFEPIRPTTLPLPNEQQMDVTVKKVLRDSAYEPVTPFWNLSVATSLNPPCKDELPYYFYQQCRMPWSWDLGLGLLLVGLAISLLAAPLVIPPVNEWIFGVKARMNALGADAKPSLVKDTHVGQQIKTARMDPEVYAEPGRWIWFIFILSLLVFIGLAMIEPYSAHITPFGNSVMVLLSIIWAVLAISLGVRYSEFLFKKSHRTYIRWSDWTLPWLLSIASVLCGAFGLWSFGINNLAVLVVSDIIFIVLIVGISLGLPWLPLWIGGELLQPHGWAVRKAGGLLIGTWHAVLQISVPFLLIRRGSVLVYVIVLGLILGAMMVGEILLKKVDASGWLLLGRSSAR